MADEKARTPNIKTVSQARVVQICTRRKKIPENKKLIVKVHLRPSVSIDSRLMGIAETSIMQVDININYYRNSSLLCVLELLYTM